MEKINKINILFIPIFVLILIFYFFFYIPFLPLFIFFIIGGSFILVKSSDFFVESAVSISKIFGVSEHTIGLTIVAFGTSLPEFAVSIIAAIKKHTATAWGNVIGSNVTNILLVLGIAMLIMKIKPSKFAYRDSIILLFITFTMIFLALNGLKFYDGFIIFLFYVFFVYSLKKRKMEKIEYIKYEYQIKKIVFLFIGIFGIAIGGDVIVKGAVGLASYGLKEASIAASIVALGTSLPELSTSIVATIKNYHGIAIGNVIGSNIVNLGLVLGLSSMIRNISIEMESIAIIFLIISSSILPLILKKNFLARKTGIIFLFLYFIFFILLYF